MFKRDRIAAVVSALVLSLAAITQANAKQTVEVAFVLDTTASMEPLIDCNPNAEIRLSLVAYRVIGDDYVTKRFDLTADTSRSSRPNNNQEPAPSTRPVAATLKAQIK
jgi:hypothetical protein